MENEKIKEKIRFLEDELEQLKGNIPSDGKQNRLVAGFRRLNQFFSSYKALLTSLVAILSLVYVQMAFGLDPFESYRSTSTTKKLAEFYRQLGDKLIYNSEFEHAEMAYKSALTLQPNNTRAIYGLAKAQVFTPAGGQKYADKGIVDVKLDYLLSLFPEDADIYFLKCINAEYTDLNAARYWCEKAIKLNDKADSIYVELGYICQKELNFDCAITNYKKALELNPRSQMANNNIGSSELLRLNLQDSIYYLERADAISPRLATSVNLGEAYRYLGETSKAIEMHKYCASVANQEGIEKERIVRGQWIVVFLPYHKNDLETIKFYAQADTIENKRAIIHYALSIDYALQGDFTAASQEFENGMKNDKDNQYGYYFFNRCLSATKILNVSLGAKSWFKESNKRVCPNKEICSMVNTLDR